MKTGPELTREVDGGRGVGGCETLARSLDMRVDSKHLTARWYKLGYYSIPVIICLNHH